MKTKTKRHSIELKHGDDVYVTYKNETKKHRVELRMIGPWPEVGEALYLVRDCRFPLLVSQALEWGYEIKKVAGETPE